VNLYLRRVREPIFNLNAHGIIQKSQHQIERTQKLQLEIVATFINILFAAVCAAAPYIFELKWLWVPKGVRSGMLLCVRALSAVPAIPPLLHGPYQGGIIIMRSTAAATVPLLLR
jgi:hypothetical protein